MLRTAALSCSIALALCGCGDVADPGPAEVTCEASWTPTAPRVGELVRLELKLRAPSPLADGARLLLGFPHPYYALRSTAPGDGFPPEPIDPASVTAAAGSQPLEVRRWQADQGHWYLLAGPLSGDALALDVPGIRVPNSAWRGFGPLLLLDEAGDGGYRRVCAEVVVDVEPGDAERLAVVAPSAVTVGERVAVDLRLEDRFGNPTGGLGDAVIYRLRAMVGSSLADPTPGSVEPGPVPGTGRFVLQVPDVRGAYVVEAWLPDVQRPPVRSNPVRISAGPATPIAWGDIHGHSGLADGWGSPA